MNAMTAETNLELMLAGLGPILVTGEFVIVSAADSDVAALVDRLDVLASVRESEGTTYVLRRSDADEHAIPYDFVAAWITLSVNSALDAVGLTAAVSAELASAGISCNVLAGHRHDHLLVPHDRAADALAALAALSERTRRRPVVVVPLDGSDLATRALRPGVTLAAEVGGTVTAVIAGGPRSEAGSSAGDPSAMAREQLDQFDRIVPTRVESYEDPPAPAIAAAVASAGPAVVCMATHGRGDLAQLVVGSVAEEVIRTVDVPVVLVSERCRTSSLVGERGRLVVCHDGSEAADHVVPVAAEFAARQAMATWIVEVVPPDEDVPDPDEPEAAPRRHGPAAVATERLDGVVERFRELAASAVSDPPRPLPEVTAEALHGADVGHAIEHFVERVGATYVAIATHGAGGLARAALGSVAMEVVRRSPCPVIVVRAG